MKVHFKILRDAPDVDTAYLEWRDSLGDNSEDRNRWQAYYIDLAIREILKTLNAGITEFRVEVTSRVHFSGVCRSKRGSAEIFVSGIHFAR